MTKKKKIKPGLGKGLGALLPSIEYQEKGFKISREDEEEQLHGHMAMIDVHRIHQNPYQPRRDFDPQALEDLKNSIIEHGVIQPITVRRDLNGYEIIAGERRLRATIDAGFESIPAYVMDIDSGPDSLTIALIENVQREDLNPIETAHGFHRLIEECGLTQEVVADKVGKDRTTVTNFLRLLRLPEKIQESLRKKELRMGHARTLLGLKSQKDMLLVWKQIIDKGLSVRETEKLVRGVESGKKVLDPAEKKKKKDPKSNVDPQLAVVINDTEDRLRHVFGTQVKIKPKSKESGMIELEFYSREDLDRLLDLFAMIEEKMG